MEKENIEQQVIPLKGDWEFYDGTFDDTMYSITNYLKVPGTWRNVYINGRKLDKYNIALYKLKIQLPQSGDYCIRLSYISSAYELYINDKLITSNGIIGTNKETEQSSWSPKFVYFHTDETTLNIKLMVSNFHCNNGGIMLPIYFGKQEPMYRYQVLSLINHIIFLGFFVGMAFYLAVFNWCINKKAQSVYLSAFCMAALLAASIIDGGSLLSIFPGWSINFTLKIEYIAYMSQITSMLYFLCSIYPDISKKHPLHYLKRMDLCYTIFLIILPIIPELYDNQVFLVIVFINTIFYLGLIIRAIMKKKPNAVIFLVGFCVFIFTCILQIMALKQKFSIQYTNIFDIYYIGVLFFLLCQSYILIVNIEENFRNSQLAYEMEVASLQAQISPHFLFNVLNNINYTMDTDIETAKRLLISLCDFLRVKYRFDYRYQNLYSIQEELDLVKAYIEIENIRLRHMLELQIHIDEELLRIKILPFTIQPLIENSIKHGYQSKLLKLCIEIIRDNDGIIIRVEDDGAGMSAETLQAIEKIDSLKRGIGISNINCRLQKCFNSKLEIESKLYKGTKISFRIPLEE